MENCHAPALKAEVQDGILMVRLSGDLDLLSAQEIHEQLLQFAEALRPQIILNLADLKVLDSAGLASFLAANRRARRHGGRIAFVIGDSHALRLFQATGLQEVFEMYSTEADAVASFSPQVRSGISMGTLSGRLRAWMESQSVPPTAEKVLRFYTDIVRHATAGLDNTSSGEGLFGWGRIGDGAWREPSR